jgi:hypothetical protein
VEEAMVVVAVAMVEVVDTTDGEGVREVEVEGRQVGESIHQQLSG